MRSPPDEEQRTVRARATRRTRQSNTGGRSGRRDTMTVAGCAATENEQ
jgi:hypothetical protein